MFNKGNHIKRHIFPHFWQMDLLHGVRLKFDSQVRLILVCHILNVLRLNIFQNVQICIVAQKLCTKYMIAEYLPVVTCPIRMFSFFSSPIRSSFLQAKNSCFSQSFCFYQTINNGEFHRWNEYIKEYFRLLPNYARTTILDNTSTIA